MSAFADRPSNAQVQTPVVLILDTSSSMEGARIDALNAAVPEFVRAIEENPLALKATRLMVIGAGGHEPYVIRDFALVTEGAIPAVMAEGGTPLGAAVSLALDKIDERLVQLNAQGLSSRGGLALLISDGAPTDPPEVLEMAIRRARKAQESGSVTLFCIGVEGADLAALGRFSVGKEALALNGHQFGPLMRWFGASVRQVSVSQVGQRVQLPSPEGWAVLKG